MEKHDLTKEEGRKAAQLDLENSYLIELKKVCKLNRKYVMVSITHNRIVIGLKETDKESSHFGHFSFGSEVDIGSDTEMLGRKRANTLNYGTTGRFTPTTDRIAYWRTIHAAELLKNWGTVSKLTNEYCKKCEDLIEKCISLNK